MIFIFWWAFDPPHVGHTAIVKSILAKKHPEKIIIIPSSARNDKQYHVSDEHRLAMLEIFVDEIGKAEVLEKSEKTEKMGVLERSEKKEVTGMLEKIEKIKLLEKESEQILRSSGWQEQTVIVDDYFIRNWKGEMITRDVDQYCREKYGDDIIHIFGTDTLESMSSWDEDGYAAKKVRKLFVPRDPESFSHCEWNEAIQEQNNDSSFWLDRHSRVLGIVMRGEGFEQIQNYEVFTDCHIPDISSTELRHIIPEYTGLKAYFEESPKFIIPGLSKRISQYILENRLYRKPSLQRGVPEGRGDFLSETTEQNPQSPPSSSKAPLQRSLLKPRILVHVCCGPDVTMPILALRDEYEVICFWYDPNIQPRSEYDKRYEAFVKVCEIEGIPYIKWAYDVGNFFTRIKWVEHTPERGEKCTYCYDMRMMVSAKLAARLKIPIYTSSLNTSPKKDLEKLFRMGHKYAEKYGIEFLDIPFRKKWGFEKSVEYTKEHDIYRQNYCGCIYSIREGGDSELKRKMVG